MRDWKTIQQRYGLLLSALFIIFILVLAVAPSGYLSFSFWKTGGGTGGGTGTVTSSTKTLTKTFVTTPLSGGEKILADRAQHRTTGACNPPSSGVWLIDGTQVIECSGITITGLGRIDVLNSASAKFTNVKIDRMPDPIVVDNNAKLIFEKVNFKGVISVQGGTVDIADSSLEYVPFAQYFSDPFANTLAETPITAAVRIIDGYASKTTLKNSKASVLLSLADGAVLNSLSPGKKSYNLNFRGAQLIADSNSDIAYFDIQTFSWPAQIEIKNSNIRLIHVTPSDIPAHNKPAKISLVDSSVDIITRFALAYSVKVPFEILEDVKVSSLPIKYKVKDLSSGNIYTTFELVAQNSKVNRIAHYCVTDCSIKNSELAYFFETPVSMNLDSVKIAIKCARNGKCELASPLLTVNKIGAGSGIVASSPAGINCGTTCSANYASGTSVLLTATPSGGSAFSSWSGCTSVSGTTCAVTMSSAKSVSATFNIGSGGGGGGGGCLKKPCTIIQ